MAAFFVLLDVCEYILAVMSGRLWPAISETVFKSAPSWSMSVMLA